MRGGASTACCRRRRWGPGAGIGDAHKRCHIRTTCVTVTEMLFKKDEDFELQPRRSKTLLISIGIHVILLIILALNPKLLTSSPKRIIRIMGQDYDLSKQQPTELVMPPDALPPRPPPPVPDKPLVQPPA